MQVAFWSIIHGQAANTSNLLAISIMSAMEYRLRILITHNNYSRSTLESSLINRKFLKNGVVDLADTGIDALSRFVQYNQIDQEGIENYTTTILKNRMDLLIGTSVSNKELYAKNLGLILPDIYRTINNYYDVLYVDVNSGYSDLSKKVIDESELVVINLNQNLSVLEEFFESKTDFENWIVLISMYDDNSRFNYKMLSRKYNLKGKVGVIPYCREFADACNDGKAVDFFMKNISCKKGDSNYEFITEVRKATKLILQKADIDTELKKTGD